MSSSVYIYQSRAIVVFQWMNLFNQCLCIEDVRGLVNVASTMSCITYKFSQRASVSEDNCD